MSLKCITNCANEENVFKTRVTMYVIHSNNMPDSETAHLVFVYKFTINGGWTMYATEINYSKSNDYSFTISWCKNVNATQLIYSKSNKIYSAYGQNKVPRS